MHSLNLKVILGFDSLSLRSRISGGVKDHTLRLNRIVACGSTSQSSGSNQGSSFSRAETYALLKQQLEVAAKSEDYKEAARLRDSLKLFEEEEPVLRLQRLLREAIAEERFDGMVPTNLLVKIRSMSFIGDGRKPLGHELKCVGRPKLLMDAARYHDELKEIAPHCLLKCTSDATTLGIRVQVRSVYIEGRSQPSRGLYFFAYRIRITNNSNRPVQLLRRHWIITDANEKTENVHGIGVIGEQPVILPNTGFEYSSACPLGTPSGRMEGDFEMKHIDKVGSRSFNVAIAPFSLSTFGDDAEAI